MTCQGKGSAADNKGLILTRATRQFWPGGVDHADNGVPLYSTWFIWTVVAPEQDTIATIVCWPRSSNFRSHTRSAHCIVTSHSGAVSP